MTEREYTGKPEILVWFLNHCFLLWHRVGLAVQRIMTELHINEFLDMGAVYLVQHPVVALFVLAMTLCCGIPVLMFVIFAVISVIFTFTGFIVIEGTILTIGSILLCGFLLGMIVVMLALAVAVGIAYFGFMEIYGLLQNSPENSPVSRYLSNRLYKQDLKVHPQNTKDADLQQQDNHRED